MFYGYFHTCLEYIRVQRGQNHIFTSLHNVERSKETKYHWRHMIFILCRCAAGLWFIRVNQFSKNLVDQFSKFFGVFWGEKVSLFMGDIFYFFWPTLSHTSRLNRWQSEDYYFYKKGIFFSSSRKLPSSDEMFFRRLQRIQFHLRSLVKCGNWISAKVTLFALGYREKATYLHSCVRHVCDAHYRSATAVKKKWIQLKKNSKRLIVHA